MKIVTDAQAFAAACAELRRSGGVGLVPTMGALHEGHLALVRLARQRARHVAVSIFVNPTQFGANEDLDRYPRSIDADLAACEREGVALVFAPERTSMYAPNERTRVHVAGLTEGLCGATRPGHFDGVCTVVAKLFALCGPCVAVFGRKDYQQLKVIERMTADLFLPVVVVGHPIVRETDGLAMSSRNRYLSEPERARAALISVALRSAAGAFEQGERDPERLRSMVEQSLWEAGLVIDYVSCVHPDELTPLVGAIDDDGAVLALAAYVGSTRLIDNHVLQMGES